MSLVADLAQGALGAVLSNPEVTMTIANRAMGTVAGSGDASAPGWSGWKWGLVGLGVGVVGGVALGLYLNQRWPSYTPNVYRGVKREEKKEA
jgi:hypothetical protein